MRILTLVLLSLSLLIPAHADNTFLVASSSEIQNSNEARLIAQRSRTSRRSSKLRRQYKRYESKADLVRAIRLAKSKQYEEASIALYDLSRNPKYRRERAQIRYILGLMLFQMNMHQMAGYQFVSVIRDGNNKYVKKALAKLAYSADYLNDRTLLNYSMGKIRLQDFPKSMRSMLRFRIGEFQFQNEEYQKAAHNFSRIPRSSPYYSKAKYMQGVADAHRNQLGSALKSLKELERARLTEGPVDTNYVAAKMGIARIYYQNRSWDKAVEAYRQIPKDSPFWHEALFEMSWALMRSAKLRSVLSNFQSLHSPYYETAYIPESLLLRGIVYLYICQYDEMDKTLNLFKNIYGPVSNKLKRYLSKRPEATRYYIDYLKLIEAKEAASDSASVRDSLALPFMLYNFLSNQGDVESTQYYIDQLLKERARARNMSARWVKSGIGNASQRLLERRINSARRKIGLQIKRHIILKNRELDKLIEQHDFARYEMLNAKKEDIKKNLGTEKQAKVDDSINREFYIQNGFEYYPFKGEYWLDELGNYHYLGTKSCE
tara:strand:- start:5296 stop:6933 length:1638 start_codon:yes stop_codon:yes gene_type:complete